MKTRLLGCRIEVSLNIICEVLLRTSFHFVGSPRTAIKCSKMKKVFARRTENVNMIGFAH